MPTVAASRLRHRVHLQAPSVDQDETTGEAETVWSTVASVWAEVKPSSGNEFNAAGAEQSEVRGRFTIRYRAGVSAAMRVLFRGEIYQILAVLPDAESGIEHLTLIYGTGVRVDP